MPAVPLTFLYEFNNTDDRTRCQVFHEFASNGARALVLSDYLLSRMMAERSFGKKIREETGAEGLFFADAHAMFGRYLDLNCPVAEARPEMILRQKLALHMASDMGIETITIHVGNEAAYPEYPLEEQFDCVRRSLDELLPCAENLGIVICIENIWHQIDTPDRLLAVKEQFPVDALGFCYDSGHANLMDRGRDFPDSNPFRTWGEVTPVWEDRALEKMLPHVVNCHLHDNNGVTDQHRLPGHGTVDWNHITSLLARAPRLKVVQSEVLPVREKESIRDICAAFARLAEKF